MSRIGFMPDAGPGVVRSRRDTGPVRSIMNKQLLAPTHPTHLDPAVELEQAQDAATVCCDMCPHPLDQHDAIAQRFCTATSAGALSRGCICTGS